MRLTQATLVRINRVSGEAEPWLAEKWSVSPDGRTITLTLRDGVTVLRRRSVHLGGRALLVRRALRPGRQERARVRRDGAGQAAAGVGHRSEQRWSSRCRRRSRPASRCSTTSRSIRSTCSSRRSTVEDVRDGVGRDDAAGVDGGPRPVRDQRVRAGAAHDVRAQPALLAEGRRGRAAAVPRSHRHASSCRRRTPRCCACSRDRST